MLSDSRSGIRPNSKGRIRLLLPTPVPSFREGVRLPDPSRGQTFAGFRPLSRVLPGAGQRCRRQYQE